MNLVEFFRAARRTSTPLLGVRTPDPASTIAAICRSVKETASRLKEPVAPVLQWDVVRGLIGLNESGQAVAPKIFGEDIAMSVNPVETLDRAHKLPEKAVLLFLNAQLIKDPSFIQAVWNLRDAFKENHRCLVMVSTNLTLPPELAQDVILFDEPYPGEPEIAQIIGDTYDAVKQPKPDHGFTKKAIAALRGLATFTVEQVAAMSIGDKGLNLDDLWERKYSVIDETQGLSVWRSKESFDDIRGVQNAKDFLSGVFNGQEPPDVVVFMDEVEKMFAGAQGDTSGTSQQQHKEILTWMQNKKVLGVLFVGHPGSGKTVIAHACGGEFKVPVIAFDVDAAQNSLVGQTGENTRNAIKAIDAMGRPIVIATCNSVQSLSPELRRRFKLSTFFFDLPSQDERMALWDLYVDTYKLGDSVYPKPDDEGWTGAEISTCCELSWRLKISLCAAAAYIVPVSRASADRVESLRKQAENTWISASEPGPYRRPSPEPVLVPKRRSISTKESY